LPINIISLVFQIEDIEPFELFSESNFGKATLDLEVLRYQRQYKLLKMDGLKPAKP
jgi:hypothetical protein